MHHHTWPGFSFFWCCVPCLHKAIYKRAVSQATSLLSFWFTVHLPFIWMIPWPVPLSLPLCSTLVIFSSIIQIFIVCLSVPTCLFMCVPWCTCGRWRTTLRTPFLPPYGSWGLNSGCEAHLQAPFVPPSLSPSLLSLLPFFFALLVIELWASWLASAYYLKFTPLYRWCVSLGIRACVEVRGQLFFLPFQSGNRLPACTARSFTFWAILLTPS